MTIFSLASDKMTLLNLADEMASSNFAGDQMTSSNHINEKCGTSKLALESGNPPDPSFAHTFTKADVC